MQVYLDGHKFTTTGSGNKMELINGEAWVTLSGRNVGVYHTFGQTDHNETLIDLSSYFTNDPYYICVGPNSVFVFESGNTPLDYDEEWIDSFVEISTITKQVVRHVTLPQTAHCYPTLAKSKLWFATPAPLETGSQYLFNYDIYAHTWSTTYAMQSNVQYRPVKMAWGKSDYLYVVAFNDLSVLKYNALTGTYLNTVVCNRSPNHIVVDSNKDVLVSSNSGIIMVVDQVADTSSPEIALTGVCDKFIDDGTHLWAISPGLTRVTKVPTGVPPKHAVLEMDGTFDFSIESFSETSFKDIAVLPAYNHEVWDGSSVTTITEPHGIVLLTDTSLFYATTLTDSRTLTEVRDYSFSVRCLSMISTGPENYYGETV